MTSADDIQYSLDCADERIDGLTQELEQRKAESIAKQVRIDGLEQELRMAKGREAVMREALMDAGDAVVAAGYADEPCNFGRGPALGTRIERSLADPSPRAAALLEMPIVLAEVLETLSLGPLDLAAKYGPDAHPDAILLDATTRAINVLKRYEEAGG